MLQDSQKTANLARIRDNQRRSRQRRKDYMQELEAKVREFEHQQVQATVEMQSAARKVNGENTLLREKHRRLEAENAGLRELLSEYGISETEVDRRLAELLGHTTEYSSPSFSEGGSTQLEDLSLEKPVQAPKPLQHPTTHQVRMMPPVTIPSISTLASNGHVRAPILPGTSYEMAAVPMSYPVMSQSQQIPQQVASWPYSYA